MEKQATIKLSGIGSRPLFAPAHSHVCTLGTRDTRINSMNISLMTNSTPYVYKQPRNCRIVGVKSRAQRHFRYGLSIVHSANRKSDDTKER